MSNYWKKYYEDRTNVSNSDPQKNIGRTKGGVSIDNQSWKRTIEYIQNILGLNNQDKLLELCCGNGLIIGELSKICSESTAVDFSTALIDEFKSSAWSDGINIICEDVNSIDLPINFYDKIILYFSIQHFTEKETILIIEKCLNSLKAEGKLFIGDIPDIDKKWNYIMRKEHRVDYFNRLISEKPMIGNWFSKDYFLAMNDYFDHAKIEVLIQPEYQINSEYRFDVLITKK